MGQYYQCAKYIWSKFHYSSYPRHDFQDFFNVSHFGLELFINYSLNVTCNLLSLSIMCWVLRDSFKETVITFESWIISSAIMHKNLGRLWLAYTELQGEFYMLQLISVDSRHFTQWYLFVHCCTKLRNHPYDSIK